MVFARNRSSFNGKPKASALFSVADAFGLPLNETQRVVLSR
jgi:hypothetical protein